MSEITEKQYRHLKQEVETTKTAAERAKGALDATINTLKSEYGVDNLKAAKKQLATLQKDAEAIEAEFVEAFEAYETKWKGQEE